jgi:preprotein translocase subunit Sss1
MKGSLWLITFIVFGIAIAMFSRGYATVLRFFDAPTLEGLLGITGYLALVIFLLGILAFIMYATERQAGNVKVKNLLFEKILGHAPNAALPGSSQQAVSTETNSSSLDLRKAASAEALTKGAKQ